LVEDDLVSGHPDREDFLHRRSGPKTLFFEAGLSAGGCLVCGGGLLDSLFPGHSGPPEALGGALASSRNAGELKHSGNSMPRNSESLGDGQFGLPGKVQGDGFISGDVGRPSYGSVLISEDSPDDSGVDAELAREISSGATGPVFLDQVVSAVVKFFRGHVFNLDTGSGYYSAQGIITHNCRCAWRAVRG
jgi:hypothetical protein